jgi:nitrate reductase NapAB chaperone NapD
MATVGAFVRVELDDTEVVGQRLDQLAGVNTFDMGEPGKIGLVIEADSMDVAHTMLTQTIRSVEGVLGVWPTYADFEDEFEAVEQPQQDS